MAQRVVGSIPTPLSGSSVVEPLINLKFRTVNLKKHGKFI